MGQTTYPSQSVQHEGVSCTPEVDLSLEKQTSPETCDTQQIYVKSCPEPVTCPKSAIAWEKRSDTTRTYRPARNMRSQPHSDASSRKDHSLRKLRLKHKPSDPSGPSHRRSCKSRTFRGRQPSVLVRRKNSTGDAQASPLHKRNDSDDNPIDTIVRRIQEAGNYVEALLRARVKAFAAPMKGRLGK